MTNKEEKDEVKRLTDAVDSFYESSDIIFKTFEGYTAIICEEKISREI